MTFRLAGDAAARLREFREAMQMTQADLGAELGRGWRTISEWERGVRPISVRPFLVMVRRAGLPVEMFEEGGPRPRDVIPRLLADIAASAAAPLPPTEAELGKARLEQLHAAIGAAINRVAETYAVPDQPVPWREVLKVLSGLSALAETAAPDSVAPDVQAGSG